MTDPTDKLAQVETATLGPRPEIADPATRSRLLVVTPPVNRTAHKEGRAVTSLATVFGKFAEAQQLVSEQVVALEDTLTQQGLHLSDVSAQLPDVKERINWLIASYYEEGCKSEVLRERITRQEETMAKLTDTVRQLCEVQTQWKTSLDQLIQIFGRVQNLSVVEPPQFAQ